jgi:hypothetical protein
MSTHVYVVKVSPDSGCTEKIRNELESLGLDVSVETLVEGRDTENNMVPLVEVKDALEKHPNCVHKLIYKSELDDGYEDLNEVYKLINGTLTEI